MVVVKEEIQEFLGDIGLLQSDNVGVRDRAQYPDFVIEFARLSKGCDTSMSCRGIFLSAKCFLSSLVMTWKQIPDAPLPSYSTIVYFPSNCSNGNGSIFFYTILTNRTKCLSLSAILLIAITWPFA